MAQKRRKKRPSYSFKRTKLIPYMNGLKKKIEDYVELTKNLKQADWVHRKTMNFAREVLFDVCQFVLPEGADYPELDKETQYIGDINLYACTQMKNHCITEFKKADEVIDAIRAAYFLCKGVMKDNAALEKLSKDWLDFTLQADQLTIQLMAFVEPISAFTTLSEDLKAQFFQHDVLKRRWETLAPIYDASGTAIVDENERIKWFLECEKENADKTIERWIPIQAKMDAELQEEAARIEKEQALQQQQETNPETEVAVADAPVDVDDEVSAMSLANEENNEGQDEQNEK